jgi:SAM-dependent methyltransferase
VVKPSKKLNENSAANNFANQGSMTMELKCCPLCETKNLQPVYLARDRHYGIPGTFKIVRCADCSLLFLNPMYSDEELSAFYPRDYYAYQNKSRQDPWKEILKRLAGLQIRTKDPQFPVPGRMLDLGCGTGWFLRGMREQGWEVHGVEINSAAAELGRKEACLNIFGGTLKQANFPSNYFDYLRANHSFEHISCPGETLDEIRRVLRPGGRLFLGVPNVAGLNARIFRQYWWYLGAPVHPFTYSVETLSRLLKKHHFCIQKVTYNSDYSGILGSLQIWLNHRNGRKSTVGLAMNNPILKVICHWTAKCIDFLKMGDAIEIVAVKSGNRNHLAVGSLENFRERVQASTERLERARP